MFNGAGVTLPGGYWSGDKLEKDITFRSLNGYSEQALLEIDVSRQLSPCYVTAMLGAMIEKVGCENFEQEHAAGLCMADRQWLMLQFARHLNSDRVWLTSKCSACSLSFDIPLDLSDLPVKAAGKDFPHVHLSVQGCDVVLRVPTGVDQENLTGLSDGSAAELLLKRSVLKVNGKAPEAPWFDALSVAAIEKIERALEDASPAVTTALTTQCPECGADQVVRINPYGFFHTEMHGLFEEVHMLAWHYHWSEQEILSLTRQRRHTYLQLIDSARGMAA